MRREYPEAPIASVGLVVLKGTEVLLVKRAREPHEGFWSIPGGVIELGETLEQAAKREVWEECGVEIEVRGVVEVVERILRDSQGGVRFHYAIVDLWATYLGGELRASSDVLEAHWVREGDLSRYQLTEGLLPIICKALERNMEGQDSI